MRQRTIRWIVALALALVVGFSKVLGGGQTSVVYGAGPTPTPTQESTNGQPGGSGGGM